MESIKALLKLCSIMLYISDAFAMRKEAYMTVSQLITEAGYPVQKYSVHTPDGYILQMYRIPRGRMRSSEKPTKAILLVHGLAGSCDNYIIMGRGKSIAYLLADAGYDVWLGNLRGTDYSSHETLTKSEAEFWEFSFHEHGKYDAPAFIDKILEVTSLPKILYLGHSMGCATFLTMLAQRPEYNDKLIAFIGIGPAGYMDNIRAFSYFGLKVKDWPTVLRKRKIYAVRVPKAFAEDAASHLCTNTNSFSVWDIIVDTAFKILFGQNCDQLDPDMTPVNFYRMQPASLRQLSHFGKVAITGVFTSWEDGVFGKVKPYNLSNVRTPVSLWYGENDQMTEKSQILRLATELNQTGTLDSVRAVGDPKFNHLDFIFAKDIYTLLNKPLLEHVEELYNKYNE